ncbi:uncharacterized protein AMSG_04760 [Thecamonas trahens ATCC 50062]|uniref:DUF4200 domain-containing protein n=1 Tax=Thecamonas trahens ATCC 50062 TaxID=461836 RepID=A0A0L0D9H0_THETB|nr:hypothetical protein AMSG_04760 [Thecamonas trahens ATCC 50062]KNC49017.1 hypothetical protein AMSG_04760 [Thecamonas trahens ATCC 50062]|eukprot:XP_013758428.1 hypothetical protein AMSG_04760 [Thecamonas trahens ATCC 50062]
MPRSGYTLPKLSEDDNPFRIPDAETIFRMRDEEKRVAAERRAQLRTLSIYEKSTASSRRAQALVHVRGSDSSSDDDDAAAATADNDVDDRYRHLGSAPAPGAGPGRGGRSKTGKMTAREMRAAKERQKAKDELLAKAGAAIRRHHAGEKQNLQAFIRNKRKMFEIKYKIGVKLDAVQKLMDEEHRRMAAVNKQKDLLGAEEDKFQEYKDEINEKLQEAAQRAEHEEELKKQQKAIKDGLTEEITRLSRKIDERDRLLHTYEKYKSFLDELDRSAAEKAAAQARVLGHDVDADRAADGDDAAPTADKARMLGSSEALLDIFRNLEESNLFLIQNSQELQEQLTSLNEQHATQAKNIDVLEGLPTEERIELIRRKVNDVYRKTKVGTSEILDVIPMLTNIERRLQELFRHVAALDESEVEAEEKARAKREKEMNRRKTKQEQAAILAQRKLDQDRRARLPLKRKVGKPLMRRSNPHTKKQTKVDSDAEKQQDAEMYRYFFL